MGATVRTVAEDELPSFTRTVQTAFGNHGLPGEVDGWSSLTDPSRSYAAFDDGLMVATASSIRFALTTPGNTTVPAAGVTAVAVLPTHRRRGVLRALMTSQLDALAADGTPLAILTASESAIYGRFGYGPATYHRSVQIDPRRSRFVENLHDDGHMELLDGARALETVPTIHDQARLGQPGDIGRDPAWWRLQTEDPVWLRRQAPEKFWACHVSGAGRPDGYVAYRMVAAWHHGVPATEVEVVSLVGLTPQVEVGLWRFVLDLDLAGRIVAPSQPLDEALTWCLADPRQLTTTSVTDHLWVRLLDVKVALGSRRYGTDGELVLEVHDAFRPQTAGRYLLRSAGAEAECVTTTRPADLSLGIAELSSAYLGHARLSVQAGAARVVEHTTGALGRADRMFASPIVPFCRSGF